MLKDLVRGFIFVGLLNFTYQSYLLVRNSELLFSAATKPLLAAVVLELVAFMVLLPYVRIIFKKSGWRQKLSTEVIRIYSSLGVGRAVGFADYWLWRKWTTAEKLPAETSLNYTIMLYWLNFVGLLILFFCSQILSLLLLNSERIEGTASLLAFAPLILVAIIIFSFLNSERVGKLLSRSIRKQLKTFKKKELKVATLSPLKIGKKLKLSRLNIATMVGSSLCSWLLSAAAMYFILGAFNVDAGFLLVVYAYCSARIFTFLPIAPGGVGEMEVAVAAVLAAYGAPVANVATAVVVFKIIGFWLPIALGSALYPAASKSPSFIRH